MSTSTACGVEAEELQKIVQNAISSEYDDAYSSAAEYVVTSLKGYEADVFLPLILAALGDRPILGQT